LFFLFLLFFCFYFPIKIQRLMFCIKTNNNMLFFFERDTKKKKK